MPKQPTTNEVNMKDLSDYIEEAQTKLFDELGIFFAFSTKQFDEAKKPGVTYVSLGHGTICPKENVDAFLDRHDSIVQEGIAQDIKENGIKAIIHRELANHEAQISGDITDTVNKLKGYDITPEQVQGEYKEFFAHCVEHDYF